MTSAETLNRANPISRRTLIQFLIGLLAGGLTGFVLVRLLGRAHVPFKSITGSDFLSIDLGVMYLALSIVLAVVSFSRKQIARQLEPGSPTLPATDDEVNTFRIQSLVLGIAGILMVTPVAVAPAVAAHAGLNRIIFASIVLLFALQTFANVRLWRKSDEFLRQMMSNIVVATFVVGQGIFFLWAAAEHLHLVKPVSSWLLYSIMMLLYLIASFFIGIRKQYS